MTKWIEWKGGNWTGSPNTRVHVRFSDGKDDTHLEPIPASYWGCSPLDPSNWRRDGRNPGCNITAYRIAP